MQRTRYDHKIYHIASHIDSNGVLTHPLGQVGLAGKSEDELDSICLALPDTAAAMVRDWRRLQGGKSWPSVS